MSQNPIISAFLNQNNFKQLSQVQAQSFKAITKGRDVIALSKTGTGKTYAYLLPSLSIIDSKVDRTQCVIICPTQELVEQTMKFATNLIDIFPEIRLQSISKLTDDLRLANKQVPHVLIGTLGKLKSLYLDKQLYRIDHIKMLIIDEADMMLDPDNLINLDEFAGKMPEKLQTLVFSATIPNQLNKFMRTYMHNPFQVNIEEDKSFDPQIEHILIAQKEDIIKKLDQLLKNINPALGIIFAKDGKQLEELKTYFNQSKYSFTSIHGQLHPRERHQVFKQIQDSHVQYVLATDLAARGLDLELATDVISLGFPSDLSFYTHRAGRIGRAGKSGRSFILYSEKDDLIIRKLMDMGLHFNHMSVSNNGFKILRSYAYTYHPKKTELDLEVEKLVKNRNQKVKPGYKKKLSAEIDKIKRKKKRQMIQASIKAQQKEKSKLKQREKR